MKVVAEGVGNINDVLDNIADALNNIADALGNSFRQQVIDETSCSIVTYLLVIANIKRII